MKYNFNKIYVFILILWIPFYYFWDWLRFKFVGDPSDGIRYVLEVFSCFNVDLFVLSH